MNSLPDTVYRAELSHNGRAFGRPVDAGRYPTRYELGMLAVLSSWAVRLYFTLLT
jgi:hypothetical protein